jgi:6-phosphogluconate dehydrogenase
VAELAELGVLGLAVMGANPARNAARKGFGVALFNRNHERLVAAREWSLSRRANARASHAVNLALDSPSFGTPARSHPRLRG